MGNGNIHIGHIIHAQLKEKHLSVIWLADQLNCTRDNVYKMLNRDYITTDMLMRISVLLDYDFFAFLSAEYQNSKSNI